jgi:hypothetical protein
VDFQRLAARPTALLEPGSPRQSRPLPIFTAHVLTRALWPLFPRPPAALAVDPTYLPFLIMNFVTLIAAVLLYLRLFGEPGWSFAVMATSTLLVANGIVRTYFWSPHTQLSNVLMPVLAMTYCRWPLLRPDASWHLLAGLACLGGALVLYYGSFVLLLPSLAAGVLIARRRSAASDGNARLLGRLAVVLGGFALVPFAWWLIVTIVAGRFQIDETGDRWFVWLIDAWMRGPRTFAFMVRGQLWLFAQHCAAVAWFPLALSAGAAAAALLVGVRVAEWVRIHSATIVPAGVTLGLTLLFFGLQGWYLPRFAWNVVPPILVVTAVLLSAVRQQVGRRGGALLACVVAAAVVGWTVHELRRDYLFVLPSPAANIRFVR